MLQNVEVLLCYTCQPSQAELKHTQPPPELPPGAIYPAARVSYTVTEIPPLADEPIMQRLKIFAGSDHQQEWNYQRLLYKGSYLHEYHQILGYPMPIQGSIAVDCELTLAGYWEADKETQRVLYPQIRERSGDWELLLQITSDNRIGMYWPPDRGILDFIIRREDLLAGEFVTRCS